MMKENHDEKVQGESEVITVIDTNTINSALELRDKVDRALSLGIPAETIGAVLMVEKGLDPGQITGPIPRSLDALLVAVATA